MLEHIFLGKDTLRGVGVDNVIQQHLEIGRRNTLQVVHRADTTVLSVDRKALKHSDRTVHTSAVHGVTDGTGITEKGQIHALFNVGLEDWVSVRLNVVLELLRHD